SYTSFFFNVTATPAIYTLSLHDALPISHSSLDLCGQRTDQTGCRYYARIPCPDAAGRHSLARRRFIHALPCRSCDGPGRLPPLLDRKSTRLNSSHVAISYAVFCLKKKKR